MSFITRPYFIYRKEDLSKINSASLQNFRTKIIKNAKENKSKTNLQALETILNKTMGADEASASELIKYLEKHSLNANEKLKIRWGKKKNLGVVNADNENAIYNALTKFINKKKEYEEQQKLIEKKMGYLISNPISKDEVELTKKEWLKLRGNQLSALGNAFENYLFAVLSLIGDEEIEKLSEKTEKELIDMVTKNIKNLSKNERELHLTGSKTQSYSYPDFGKPFKMKKVSSPGKVDVDFSVNKNNLKGLTISAKSIYSANNIKILSNTTIANALGAWQNNTAVNAYLNYSRFNNSFENDGAAIFSTQALVGRTKEAKANVFAINVRSNVNPIKLIDMSDIVTMLDELDSWNTYIIGLENMHQLLGNLYKEIKNTQNKLPELVNKELQKKMHLQLKYSAIKIAQKYAKNK